MTPEAIERAVGILADARLAGDLVAALPAPCRPVDEPDGYAIQQGLHARLEGAGYGARTGHKIGCTTPVMQAFLDIHNPCAGGVFAPTARDIDGQFDHGGHRRPGVECEIAVRLADDLSAQTAPFSRERVVAAVGEVMAAIEVVDDRYDDYGALGAPTLIADDFFDAGCVLGPPVADWHDLDLATIEGEMRINGEPVGRGRGGDIMGHPLAALAWLADHRARRGTPLRAGEFVLLGSVVETKWVAAGDIVEIALSGLGEARARF